MATWEPPKRKRPDPGFLNHQHAVAALREAIIAREIEIDDEATQLKADNVDATAPRTLLDVGTAWINYAETIIRTLRPSTAADYRLALRAIARSEHFADKPIEDITAADVRAWRDEAIKDGKSARTVNKCRQLLSNVLGWAAQSESYPQTTTNVVTSVEKIKEARPGRIDYYTMAEIEQVARIMREGRHRRPQRVAVGRRVKGRATVTRELTDDERKTMAMQDEQDAALVITLAMTGLRLGEAQALRWRDVDLDVGHLRIGRSFSGTVEGPTKGGRERIVPALPRVAEVLAKLGLRGYAVGRDDLVFVGGSVDGRVDARAFSRRYRRATTVAGLRPLRVHDLRHGYLSLAAKTLPLHEVQALAGHSSITTTSRYLHTRDDPQQVARLMQVFGAGTPAELVDHPA